MELAIALMVSITVIVIAVRSTYRDSQRRTIQEQRSELARLRRELERHNDKPE